MKICDISEKDIKYIKITYIDVRDEKYEIKTHIKLARVSSLTLEHECHQKITPKIPQISLMKIVTKDAMYIGRAKIINVFNYNGKKIDIDMDLPTSLQKRQVREYFRINHVVGVMMSCRTHHGMQGEMFLARTIDISAGGVRITGIKSLKTGKQVPKLDFKKFYEITIGIYLDPKIPINFNAVFIRHQEDEDGVISDAFEFLNPNIKKVEYVKNFVDEFRAEHNL